MKTISFKLSTIFMLFISSITFIGCSGEDAQKNEEVSTTISQRLSINSEVDGYVGTFYASGFEYGESRETSDENTTYVVTEVLVNSETSARGYVVTEKLTDNFLYFVDVDRIGYNLTTFDVVNNYTRVFHEIDKNEEYFTTHEFDFIVIVDTVNSNSQRKRKFFGWSGWEPMGPCENGEQTLVNVHYALWLTNAYEYMTVPC